MKFLSYDAKKKQECKTEIRNAELTTIHLFVQTWVPDFINRSLHNPGFSYQIFEWDRIIKLSFEVGPSWRCYGAFTVKRLDGLLCLGIEQDKLKIEFIATAPWNYYTIGMMRGIGSGLIYFTIRKSIYTGHEGEFLLNALPDAEKFYEGIGMVVTGSVNDAQLKEYFMPKDAAAAFSKQFSKYVIEK